MLERSLHLGTRRCWISPCTVTSDSAWVSPQAKNFLFAAEDWQLSPKILMRDNDAKYSQQFDDVFKTTGVTVMRNKPCSPNLRAHVERFIQSLKFECLSKFLVVSERHLNYINK